MTEPLTPEQRLAALEQRVLQGPDMSMEDVAAALKADPEVMALVMHPEYLQRRLAAQAKTPPPRD